MVKKEQTQWLKAIRPFQNEETPFLVIDLKKVDKQIDLFRKYFPECELYYAIKSLGEGELLEHVAPKVDGFDIASLGEFRKVQHLVAPEKVFFSNPVKKPEHIAATSKAGVNQYAFDSLGELTKIAQTAPGADVYLRLKVSDHGSAFPLSRKFGASAEHAVPFMDTARELGLNPKGLTFHVGSQSESVHTWEVAIEACGQIMARLEKVGIKLEFVDIGGGFPAEYVERVPHIKQIVKAIRAAIKEHFPYTVRLVAEPGRYLVAEAGMMVTTVIGREHRVSNDWLFLDIGAFNGMIEPLEFTNWKYPVFCTASMKTDSLPRYFTLTGPSCDASDTFGFDVPLPSGIVTGDKVYIGSAGAYTVVYASDFNGFNIPKCYYINR